MKKIILLVFILFLLLACNSGDLEMKKEFYPSGKLKMTHYEDSDGNWQGECKVYFQTGKLEQVKQYKDDQLNGIYLEYDKKGNLRIKSKFKNDKEIDTTIYFSEDGTKECYVIYNEKSEKTKEIFYYSNGKIKKERTFMVGKGLINAFKSYSSDGELLTKYPSSKFINFKKVGDSINFQLKGLYQEEPDSIVVKIVKDFDFNYYDILPHVIRRFKYFDKNSLYLKIYDSDYFLDKVSILISVYGFEEGHPDAQPFYVQFEKGQKIPKDNLYPIYSK